MKGRSIAYWTLAGALTLFGLVSIFSLGAPFFLLGVTLLAVGPFRHRRTVFVPAVIGLLAFIAAFILVTPLGCTSTATAEGGPGLSHTTCTNILGIGYSGGSGYNPSLLPALVAGLIAAGAIAIGARRALRTR